MKPFKRVKKYGAQLVAAGAGMLALGGAAHAAGMSDALTTATTTALADIATGGAAIIGVVVAVVAFNWFRRVIH